MTRIDTPDFRFLADCCAVASGAPSRPVPPGIDGKKLETLAQRHRVSAPVLRLLAGVDAPIDEAVRARLFTRSLHQTFRANAIAEHCASVSAALSAASVPHLLLKGPALAQQLFGNVAARICKDLDILLHPDDFAAADACLRSVGFAPLYPGVDATSGKDVQYGNRETGLDIELHRRMCSIDALLPTRFETLWSARRTVTICDVAVPILDAETEFLYLCAHGARHAWFRLRWLQDIARILLLEPPETLAGFSRFAERSGIRPAVASAVALVDEVFGIAPDPAVSALLPIGRSEHRVMRTSLRALEAPASTFTHRSVGWIVRMTRLQWVLRPDRAYKRALLSQIVVAPPDMMSPPRWARGLGLPLLVARLGWRRVKAFRLEKRISR